MYMKRESSYDTSTTMGIKVYEIDSNVTSLKIKVEDREYQPLSFDGTESDVFVIPIQIHTVYHFTIKTNLEEITTAFQSRLNDDNFNFYMPPGTVRIGGNIYNDKPQEPIAIGILPKEGD